VFSFGVVLWELLTCKIPYSDMTPLQAAVGVVQKGLRPAIPPNCLPQLAGVMNACWDASPMHRCVWFGSALWYCCRRSCLPRMRTAVRAVLCCCLWCDCNDASVASLVLTAWS
jgi:hypothetical protein